MRFIDLFGGIGGFRLGMERAGHECVWYCDIDKGTIKIYNRRFEENNIPTDITKMDVKSIPSHEVLCAGFPCQTFSFAGQRKGFEDTRGTLFFEIVRIARHHKPKILFLENVKGLLSAGPIISIDSQEGQTETVTLKGYYFFRILESLDEIGYDVEWKVLNSKHFGVPQNRERVFIIGHLREGSRQEISVIEEGS